MAEGVHAEISFSKTQNCWRAGMHYLNACIRTKLHKQPFQFIFIFHLALLSFFVSHPAYALDIIKFGAPQSDKDDRSSYPVALLNKTLEITKSSYGPYKVETSYKMTRNRALLELQKGELINIHEAPTRPEWEEKVLPIYVPIRKGLLGYRLFLIHKDNQSKLDKVQNIEDLKSLVAGLGAQWSITLSMKHFGFTMNTSLEYEHLFKLLHLKRFDYFPRGISEVFTELEMRKETYPDIVIESKKAFYLPLPTYFFVSPKTPHLAERIEKGLWLMIKNGSFDKLFDEYFSEVIAQAKLDSREILSIENPFVPYHKTFKKEELWFR
ncbi:MAG: hypothetical protein ACJAS1_001490 [Oleiphilaceae bacterium]|jgi:hypothetical protein